MNKLKTVPNFRDLGGIKNKNGMPIKTKQLLRSGELYQISEDDKQLLADTYQVQLIVDFRNPQEAAAAPDETIAGSTYLNINVMQELAYYNTGLEDQIRRIDKVGVDGDMKEVYEKLVTDPFSRQEFGRFIRQTAALESGACLFHCFAGKDRTGVAAALLLEILEADRNDIYDDYLQTNTLRRPFNTIILDQARAHGMSQAKIDIFEQLLLVKKEYLEHMYETIERHYSSFDNYLRTGLNVSDDDRMQLKKRCLTS